MEIKDAINEINKDYNFPGLNKLIKLVQSKYDFSKDDIIKSVKSDTNAQLVAPKLPAKSQGHIVSLTPNELMQMDLFDLQRFRKSNIINKKTYLYIYVVIDVFSRYVYAEPLENKTDTVVLEAFEKLYNKIMDKQKPLKIMKQKTKSYAIHQIISDNEGSFQSNIFEKYLIEKNIILTMNASNDHHVLGIIDNFAKRLKTILKKTFLFNNSTNWINVLDNIIKIYNNTPHSALNGLSPEQAMKPENYISIQQINMNKMENNKRITDLKIDDKVRKYSLFKKSISKPSITPAFSDEVYYVIKVDGSTVYLNDGSKNKRYNLLHVPDDTEITNNKTKNVITQLLKPKGK